MSAKGHDLRMSLSDSVIPGDYAQLLAELKTRVRAARLGAAVAVNRELVQLYWRIGRDILDRQANEGWGAKVVDRLANDLRAEFPDMTGFSSRNLKYMRSFAEAYPELPFVQQAAAQLPWGHHTKLIATCITGKARR
jgi:predicted nuclease of restriction endonuclease-like (RecB) superfamily